MDPTSTELSVDYDPITGRSLRSKAASHSPVQSSPRPFRGCDAHNKPRDRTLPKKTGSKPERAADTCQTRPTTPLSPESVQQSIDYDPLDDGSGWNIDAGAQTQFGIQIQRHFTDMRTAFLYLDTDRDGRITKQELRDICKQWMIPVTEAKRVMKAADLNNDGTLDFEEFAQRFDPFIRSEEASPTEPINCHNPADDRPIGGSGRYAWPAHEEDMEKLTPVVVKPRIPESPQGSRRTPEACERCAHLQSENAELIERLAQPCHQCIDLKLENASLRRRIAELEEQLARVQNDSTAKARLDREKAEREKAEQERAAEERRWRDQERERLQREEEERALESARRQEQEALKREREMEEDDAESNTVFVYGRAGSPETDAMQKALRDASIPFQSRDFDTDRRWAEALAKSGCAARHPHPPIVCFGNRVWWDDPDNANDGMFDIPFASTVAMDLRHILGIKAKQKDTSKTMPIRTDADIDTEIAERYLTMQQAFLHIDYDQDGFITMEELKAKCREWNIPISEAQRTINEADMDHDGALDFDEFAKRFNPFFITKGNNGRGCYRGGAPAPTNYSSPKIIDVMDHDETTDRKERRERRTRKEEHGDAKDRKVCKERRENNEHKPSRESKSGEQREREQQRDREHRDAKSRKEDGDPKTRKPQRSTSSSKIR